MSAEPLPLPKAILTGFRHAAEVVAEAAGEIERASRHAAKLWEAGGKLVYVGAGASGLIAAQDASELPGTFGLDKSRIVILLAGGVARPFEIDAAAEDDADAGRAAVIGLGDLSGSIVLAVSASGTTSYTLGAAGAARDSGAYIISVSCRRPSPLLDLGDVSLLLETGVEALNGSTRLAAGTAQKCALGLFSTLFGEALGHIHAGHMINLKVENEKLRRRAIDIISDIAGVETDCARDALAAAEGDVKSAILIARGALGLGIASKLLSDTRGRIPQALASLGHAGVS
jgi:N-acetylmuramic acid 6-phosphate etherase